MGLTLKNMGTTCTPEEYGFTPEEFCDTPKEFHIFLLYP